MNKYPGPPLADLQQSDVIEQLRRMGVAKEEAEARVQAALLMASVLDREQTNAIYFSKKPLDLESLPLRWAAHCIYHGARPQRR